MIASQAAEWNLPGGDWPIMVQMGIVVGVLMLWDPIKRCGRKGGKR
jgi:hypothetical protein